MNGDGACSWRPRAVSVNVIYHKEQQCIWFIDGVLNDLKDISLVWTGEVGTLWNPLVKLHIHIYHILKIHDNRASGYWELVRTKFGWIFACPQGKRVRLFESWNCLHNFISTSIKSQRILGTENLSGQTVNNNNDNNNYYYINIKKKEKKKKN